MRYNFDKTVCREGSQCEKFDLRKEIFGTEDVLPMWVADTDFETPEFITNALIERAKHPLYGYSYRSESFANSIVGWYGRRHDWHFNPEDVCFTPGVVSGVAFALEIMSSKGDGVVIQPPVYPPFARTINYLDRNVVNNPLISINNHFEINFDDLDIKLQSAKVMILCSPHNPTGRVFSDSELFRIGELCVKHDVMIISDEIHCDLIFKPYYHHSIAQLDPRFAERSITLVAPSKTFNLPGLSTSAAIITNPELRAKFDLEVNKVHITQGNIFGAIALEQAYNYGDEWVDQLMVYIADNRSYVEKFLSEKLPSVTTYRGEGSFLMWLNFSEWGMKCVELNQFMIEKAKLGLNSGIAFGVEGEYHMRLNIGTQRAMVKQAMDQLLDAYNKFM